jgi:hypothetical protein
VNQQSATRHAGGSNGIVASSVPADDTALSQMLRANEKTLAAGSREGCQVIERKALETERGH